MEQPVRMIEGTLARAVAAHQAGNLSEAEFLYRLVLRSDKNQFDALHMLAVIEGQRGNFPAALSRIKEALRSRPKSVDALINLGRIQGELGDTGAAVAAYGKALMLDPRSALAHSNLSILLRKQNKLDEALTHCDAAIKLAPTFADAWSNRGNVLFDLERFADALADYDKAVALQANHAAAHFNRGNALVELKRHEEALASYRRALSLHANYAEAWLGCGNVLFELKRREDALTAFDRALALKPDLAAAWLGRGNVCVDFRRYAEALTAFTRALQADPDLPYAEGHRLHSKLHLCDWTNLEAEIAQLLSGVGEGRLLSVPFALLSLPATAADQFQAARCHVVDLPRFLSLAGSRTYAHERVRLAYVSSDLRDHAVGFLTIGLFETHDRSRFETTAISFGPESDSPIRARMKKAFDRFIDAGERDDQQVAELIRGLEIDIAVDLNGFTRSGKLGVFSRRPAPIQVNWLGYAGTMGAEFYDYIVADPTVIPTEQREFYTEKIVWLPDTFLPTDRDQAVSANTPSRSDLGLPENGFVFSCFNQSHKIEPTIFDIWMRLLQAVEGSVLWLKPDNVSAVDNLRSEAERRGVAPQRLVFAAPVERVEDHLARLRQADLFLDTRYYNAHTTAADALRMGVPVVTCIGETFAARVAASLLRAIGLPELVTESLAEYEALALKLARDQALLVSLKAKLARNHVSYPLFDTKRFTRNIEAAYTSMWERAFRGEPPDSFAVEAVEAARSAASV